MVDKDIRDFVPHPRGRLYHTDDCTSALASCNHLSSYTK